MFLLPLSLSLRAESIERRIVGLLDCSGLSLETVDGLLTTRRDWIVSIDFQQNHFVVINVTKLLKIFSPNLQHIDLRGNSAFDCRTIRKSKMSVKSDCKLVHLWQHLRKLHLSWLQKVC